jgi:hypothetical protein
VLHAVSTLVTLDRGPVIRVQPDSTKGTFLNADATANAFLRINHPNPTLSLDGLHGTALGAGSNFTLSTDYWAIVGGADSNNTDPRFLRIHQPLLDVATGYFAVSASGTVERVYIQYFSRHSSFLTPALTPALGTR